jgi:prepilin-type processing-associated H-X9-DG protein
VGTGTTTNLFICPSQKIFNPAGTGYGYSYSLDCGQDNYGIGLDYQPDTATTPVVHFKSTMIKRPTDKIMFVEEPDSLTDPNEMPRQAIGVESQGILDDGRWEPAVGAFTFGQISVRHNPSGVNAGGNVTFADGHAQLTPATWATNLFYNSPTNN